MLPTPGLEKGQMVGSVAIDLKVAFESVNRAILCQNISALWCSAPDAFLVSVESL